MAHRDAHVAETARSSWLGPALLVATVGCIAGAGDLVSPTAGWVLRLVAGLMVVGALVWGAWHHGSSARGAWLLLAVGLGGWVIGDASWDAFDTAGLSPASGWYDVVNVVFLAMYPVIFVALTRIVNPRGRRRRSENVVDFAIMFLTAVLLLQILIQPHVKGSASLDWLSALYPFGDALLLAAVGWLLFTQGRRNASAWLLGSGLVLLIGLDAAWETTVWSTNAALDQWINPLYPVSYALVAAAVLHPAAAHLADHSDSEATELHPARLGFLLTAIAMIPIAAFLSGAGDPLVVAAVVALVAAVSVRLAALVGSIQDAHRQAEASASRFAGLAAAAPVAILEADADLMIVFANDQTDRFLGTSIVGRSAESLIAAVVDDRDHAALNGAVTAVQDGAAASVQVRIHDAGGSQRWVVWSAVPVRKEPGPFAGAFVSITDITPIKDAEQVLTLQATHDALTGLPNRRMLLDRLSSGVTPVYRVPATLAVLFLDLDGFKPVNDRLGHEAGDDLLVLVSTRLLHAVRAEDTVARLGGDEFVIVLERVSNRSQAVTVAHKIIQAIEAPASLDREDVTISASIGVALSSDPGVDPDTLLREADLAMYAAKRAGRGLVRVADGAARRPRLTVVRRESPA
jgi:diguanylate cyclase (GGDEF)-like protein/PAS domain S-box-containing protein